MDVREFLTQDFTEEEKRLYKMFVKFVSTYENEKRLNYYYLLEDAKKEDAKREETKS